MTLKTGSGMKATSPLDNIYNKSYNTYMEKEPHQTIRIWVKTHHLLRLIAAHTNESMVKVLHRLAQAEYERVKAQEQQGEKR